ncbi:3-methyladenine DNA glycosylase [bacterium B17]|nr:3-methyladenine DNA glycosylase [bacterium B17]
MVQKLDRQFYNREADLVASELLGKCLVRNDGGVLKAGRIVETEAYLGAHDKASHSSKGLAERTKTMFGPPGHAYVYIIYGMYYCMNVVTGAEGSGAAVLLRAIEPVENVEGKTCGPGLLSKAMNIDLSLNGVDLLGSEVYIADVDGNEQISIAKGPRIGVGYAGRWAKRHLRFYIHGNKFVSKQRR